MVHIRDLRASMPISMNPALLPDGHARAGAVYAMSLCSTASSATAAWAL